MRRLASCLALLCAPAAFAQQPPPGLPSPRLQSAFPPGAKVGSAPQTLKFLGGTFRTTNVVTVVGADLDEPTGLLFSHPGIKAEYIPPPVPKAPPPDPKKKDPPPAMAAPKPPAVGPHKFKVSVAADVPVGTYDVRFVGKWGVSNPRAFAVGTLNEVVEKEPNNDVPDAQRVEIGTTISGVITNQTDVDYCTFAGKKGQRVLLNCQASSLDSKLRPMIEVYDGTGRKLAFNRGYRDNDALADVILPADGDYLVRLFEFTYQTGSTDHFYRLTISTAPWIDAVFPPAVEPGKPTQVTLYGRNLPGGQPADGFTIDGRPLEKLAVTVTPPADATRIAIRDRVEPGAALQDAFEYRLKDSNAVPIFFAKEKVVLKKNAGGTKPDTAEPIATPCEVAGMISRRGDRDWYSFDAKKGVPVFLELTAERNGSAADFYFTVHNPQAKNDQMGAEQDDDNEMLHPSGFYNRTGDPPTYKFTPPQDGKYLVGVGARESSFLFGPRTAYRLRVGPAKPDFRAVIMPYSRHYQTGSAARQDGTEAFDVYVHRTDGFNGTITLTAEGLPAGVTAKPTTIGPAAKWGAFVLNVSGGAAAFTGPIVVKATSTSPDGKPLVREVRPASVTWGTAVQPGNNVPMIARLDQSLVLAVRPEKAFFNLAPDLTGALLKGAGGKDEKLTGPLTIKQGEKLTVPVKVAWVAAEKQAVVLTAEPMTLSNQANPFTTSFAGQPTKEKPESAVTLDARTNAFPGTYTVVLKGEAQIPFVRDAAAKGKSANVPVSALSTALEVTIIPKEVAKLTVTPPANNQLKADAATDVVVKVERLYDFAGEYKVAFVPAKEAGTAVTAKEVVIPAGKDEAKLSLTTAKDAKAGAVAGTITVTAMYAGKHAIAHESKVNYTVVPVPPAKK